MGRRVILDTNVLIDYERGILVPRRNDPGIVLDGSGQWSMYGDHKLEACPEDFHD